MDRIHATAFSKIDDPWDVQIRRQRFFVFDDQVRLIRARAVQAVGIFLIEYKNELFEKCN